MIDAMTNENNFCLQHMVQTGMAAPYGGGVFPPPVNGVAGVVGAAGAAGEVKPPPPVPVKEDNSGAPQQPPPSGPQVPPPAGAPHATAPGAPTTASFSPPPPPNGVDQQAIVSHSVFHLCQSLESFPVSFGVTRLVKIESFQH